jgi:hypothetical protein
MQIPDTDSESDPDPDTEALLILECGSDDFRQ